MEYTPESIRFLHIAFLLMALGQLAYVAFLVKRWRDVRAASAALQKLDD